MRVKSGISNVIIEQCNNKSDCSIMWCLLLLESRNHARNPIIAQSSILQQSTNNTVIFFSLHLFTAAFCHLYFIQ